jgi:DNA polymerase III epsilon subunit-like protein
LKHLYKINKTPICLVGELDYVNITDNCLVDIKCSESDFKLEWLIQLLLYYSLCKSNNVDIEIDKVAIMNIVTGKYYEINIHNYEYTRLLTFVETIIKDNIEGKRETYNENIDITMMLKNIKNHINQKPDVKKTIIKINKHQERNGYIVMDVENNTCNNDIVQIAYIMFDNNNKELKRVNKYIKNRIIDQRASLLTNITNDILVKKGYEFNDIIQELYNDLSQVKILVGHNIMTDISKLNKNIEKYNIELSYNPFDEISIKDTMNMYKKRIKLKAMYEEMFSDTVIEYHNAMCDVECTAKCYVVMNE